MVNPARIVLLNGVGSAGKTSIAKALQAMASEPYLHVAMDAFLDRLPEALLDHEDGYRFETVSEDSRPSVIIHEGAVGRRLMRGMRRAVAALAHEGNNLILDEVLIEGALGDYASLLAPYAVHLVGVVAPLEVIEAREAQRSDRLPGLARWQFDRVHRQMQYHLIVDTSQQSAPECAALIKRTFGL